jgi:hypothetical protein
MKDKQLIIYLILVILLATASLKMSAQTGVSLKPKRYLQGALHGLLPAATLMRDDLRAKGYIPLNDPNSIPNGTNGGVATITDPAVLQVTGNNAIRMAG